MMFENPTSILKRKVPVIYIYTELLTVQSLIQDATSDAILHGSSLFANEYHFHIARFQV